LIHTSFPDIQALIQNTIACRHFFAHPDRENYVPGVKETAIEFLAAIEKNPKGLSTLYEELSARARDLEKRKYA
jgi:hypothetical protein